MTMNPSAQAEFDRIVAQGPDGVTEDELAFLTARRSYLTAAQREAFGINEDAAPKAKGKRAAAAATDEGVA